MSTILKFRIDHRVYVSLTVLGIVYAFMLGTASAQMVPYSSGGFESLDPNSFDPNSSTTGTELGDDGWLVGANVFATDPNANYVGVGAFQYNYFAFPAPHATGGFSNITADGSDPNNFGDPPNGDRGIVVFSDYLNGDHDPNGNNYRLESVFFREQTVTTADVGKTAKFSFVARPDNLEGDSLAHGRITVINPSTGFSLTALKSVETTVLPSGNSSHEISIGITKDMVGQLFQVGFDNYADSFEGSGVDYDDVELEFNDTFGSYSQDFESVTTANAADSEALSRNGWKVFGAVFDSSEVFKFQYGPFGAPNDGAGFSNIAGGEGGVAQGAQYLNTFSDYNCCSGTGEGHFNGTDIVDSSIFQEFMIGTSDPNRQMSFSFDAKLPSDPNVAFDPNDPSTTATFYIRTIDPNSGFSTTAESTIDATTLGLNGSSWVSGEVLFDIVPGMEGQLIQFGITNRSSDFDSTGILLDNISFDDASTGLTADVNGDGRVDGKDFLEIQRTNPSLIPAWEAEYGSPLEGAVTAVPEPSSVLLCVMSVSLLAGMRRRS